MAASIGKQASIINELIESPQSFDFFQAIRLIRRHLSQKQGEDINEGSIRFHANFKNNFAVSPIDSVKLLFSENQEASYHIYSTFMGLVGSGGVLPERFSEYLSKRLYQDDVVLRDFLDIFNHIILSLLYTTWSQSQLAVIYEEKKKNNLYTKIISSLCGIGMLSLQDKLLVPDEAIFCYSGLFAKQHRSAKMLEIILADFFQLPVRVLQFQREWLRLSEMDRTILYCNISANAAFNQLGKNVILGSTCQGIQNKFRIYIGPVNYKQFDLLKPGGMLLTRLYEMVHFYVRYELSFDVQIELIANEIPFCQLLSKNPPMLGWNTWVHSNPFLKNSSAVVINQ